MAGFPIGSMASICSKQFVKQKGFFQKSLFRYGRYDIHRSYSCINRRFLTDKRLDLSFGCGFKQRPCADFQQDFRMKISRRS